jgi:exosortase/archaeosortase family protein
VTRARAKTRKKAASFAFGPTHPLWFPARFLGIWLVAILALSAWPGPETWAMAATVESLRLVLLAASGHPDVQNGMIQMGGVSFQIVSDCTPLMPTILLTSAMLAFPATWRWKALGLASGAAALWIYNLVRVLALCVVKGRWPQAFAFVHVYVWQSATLLVVFLLFLGWLGARSRWERFRARPRLPDAPAGVAVSGAVGGE